MFYKSVLDNYDQYRCLSVCQPSYAPLAISMVSPSSSSSSSSISTTTAAIVGGRSNSCCITTTATHRSIAIMRLLLIACVGLIILSPSTVSAQETSAETSATTNTESVCNANEIFDGKTCKCAPGYFMKSNRESKSRCEDECEKVYFTFFTYGACIGDIYGRIPKNAQAPCNLRCGLRIRTLASIGIFATFAAALATLIFTLPLCITTCASCLNARRANKTAKRVFIDSQNQPYKEQQLQTLSYNPYAYWPYYGRA
ncbi:unnamed protein product [Cercopithifilaria johnstoni]|uniref:Uncharacterized protein n=1 Tax=Cercopithifilaria johnstoni TaxID=2874296 RepID=A0A8J2MME9_9BILA|nr:unnamed protein product [Cercopithifilaria johnstoni]